MNIQRYLSSSVRKPVCGLLLCVSLIVASCGGGGGSDAPPPNIQAPLPALSEDVSPTGARSDQRAKNYFPFAQGDTWTYSRGTSPGQTVTTVLSAAGGDIVVSDQTPTGSSQTTYRRTADGVVVMNPFGGQGWVGLESAVPSYLEYPDFFDAPGADRVMIRQGSLGVDLDGDGYHDSFRIELRKTFVGFETVQLAQRSITNCAHIRSSFVITIQPSRLDRVATTNRAVVDSWFAPGIGLIKEDSVSTDGSGAISSSGNYSISLVSSTIGGQAVDLSPPIDGRLQKIELSHQGLIYDASRNVYYASVSSSVALNGNKIAKIDPTTGSVTYSEFVGSDPGALAIAADGTALFVSLDGSGELAKLSLPSLAQQWKIRLTQGTDLRAAKADQIAVSPSDSNLVAVSLIDISSIYSYNRSTALVRSGALQVVPPSTNNYLFSYDSQLFAFNQSGNYLYQIPANSSSPALTRYSVQASGAAEDATLTGLISQTSAWAMDYSASGLLLIGSVVVDSATMSLRGRINVTGGNCRMHTATGRAVCLPGSNFSENKQTLTVADPATVTILSTPTFQNVPAYSYSNRNPLILVPGPRGQVALGVTENTSRPYAGKAVWLFTSPALE